MSSPPEQTQRLLERIDRGDRQAEAELFSHVHAELRLLAQSFMGGRSAGETLQPTALVGEVWIRMSGRDNAGWESRGHFFGVAAKAMRSVLVDHSRRKQARKRSDGGRRLSEDEFTGLDLIADAYEAPANDLVALDEALERLAEFDPQGARIVELRFFAGLDNESVASALGISGRHARRGWRAARLWLRRELGGGA